MRVAAPYYAAAYYNNKENYSYYTYGLQVFALCILLWFVSRRS